MRTMLKLLPALIAALAAAAPAFAQQVDLRGMWSRLSHEDNIHRVPGPDLGDYTGIPVNAAGRLKAESWDASILSLPEEQAKPHAAQYSMRGPGPNFRMGAIVDPQTQQIVAYTITNLFGNADRTIWLDGRPHPSRYAEHQWSGFSTGVWEGGALKVTTTHMKTGWLQRNGVTASARSVMTEYFVRHGNHLLLVTIIEDPVYLEEPFVRTSNFAWTPSLTIPAPPRFVILDEIAGMPKGYVPSYPMGTRHTEFANRYGLPLDAARGGRHTLYPEYAATLRALKPGVGSPSDTLAAEPIVRPPTAPGRPEDAELEMLRVQGNVHMIAGPTGNVTALVGDEGVLLVDTNLAAVSARVAAAIRQLSNAAIGMIINTSADQSSVGANDVLARMGESPVNTAGNFGIRIEGAPILAHENALKRMSAPTGVEPVEPFAKWPSLTISSAKFTTSYNGEPIEVLFQPQAHTDGDVIVFFRRSDVISTGSVFNIDSYPVIDLQRGGSVQGTLDALNQIIDLTIPEFNQQRGTLVVPGKGRVCNEADVVEYRDMVTIIRDRIQRMIGQGMTLAQVRAARPTLDYDGLYGSTTGPWTTDMFIAAVYQDLSASARRGSR
jgi:glyoxylase-like metal-dependent hydrolase (beta-lactamase superfamily II)